MEKDCAPWVYSWETEAVSTLWCAEPASEGVKHAHDLASALLAGSSAALCIKGVHAVHPCLRSILPVWMWPWFAPRVCLDHKNKRSLHHWDADCIEALETRWSLVLNTVSGSKETGSESGSSKALGFVLCCIRMETSWDPAYLKFPVWGNTVSEPVFETSDVWIPPTYQALDHFSKPS